MALLGFKLSYALLNVVYMIQPVVKQFEQPVECLFTWCSQLFNRFECWLYRINGVLEVLVFRKYNSQTSPSDYCRCFFV